jgi:hypothetical protein
MIYLKSTVCVKIFFSELLLDELKLKIGDIYGL